MERALGRLEGVQKFEAPIGALTIEITPARDRVLHLAAIRPALWKEGIRVQRMTLVAEGNVEGSGDTRRFRIRGWPEAYPLDGGALPKGTIDIEVDIVIKSGVPHLTQ